MPFLSPVLITLLVMNPIWWVRNWGKRTIFRPPFLMLQFNKWGLNQPFQDSQQPMSAWVNGCCRCLLCVSSPFLPKELTQMCCKPLDLNLHFRESDSLCLCRFSSSYIVQHLCFFFVFKVVEGGRERGRGERPTRGKKVDASVKTPLLSLWFCELLQANFHLQYQFGLILPSVCRERSLLAKRLFLE